MKKNLALLALASLLVVACAEAPLQSGTEPQAEAPSEPTSTSSPETPDPGPGSNGDQNDPAIVVRQPQRGATVTSPVTVSGDANVFEATVSFRILDANGNEIATSFTTATCGSGCRGDYTGEIEFSVDREQHGVIEVFESSAEDGSDLHKVAIPVTLSPN